VFGQVLSKERGVVTHKRERDLGQIFSAAAEQHGAQFLGIEPTHGGHLRARFAKGNASRFMIIASSPHNIWRSKKNNMALARQLLRGIA
jgi:hypothetical protein